MDKLKETFEKTPNDILIAYGVGIVGSLAVIGAIAYITNELILNNRAAMLGSYNSYRWSKTVAESVDNFTAVLAGEK